jgi:hypothetical protein
MMDHGLAQVVSSVVLYRLHLRGCKKCDLPDTVPNDCALRQVTRHNLVTLTAYGLMGNMMMMILH